MLSLNGHHASRCLPAFLAAAHLFFIASASLFRPSSLSLPRRERDGDAALFGTIPRLNYWTILLGPKFSKRDRRAAKLERSYYVHQVEYCQNFIFKPNHPIRKIFERSYELGLWSMTGGRIWRTFGRGHRDRIKGKLQTMMERIEHGQHVFRFVRSERALR